MSSHDGRDDNHLDVTGKFPGGEVNLKGSGDRVLVIALIVALGVATFFQHHQMKEATDRLTCILSMPQETRGPALNSGDPCSYFFWIQGRDTPASGRQR